MFVSLLTFNVHGFEYYRRQNPCEIQCANVAIAVSICSNARCLCPTLAASGPQCIACLSANGDQTGAVTLSSYLATDCICSTECASVTSVFSACSSQLQCACPTLSVVGPPCISCLFSLGYPTDASPLASILTVNCPLEESAQICSEKCGSITSVLSVFLESSMCMSDSVSRRSAVCLLSIIPRGCYRRFHCLLIPRQCRQNMSIDTVREDMRFGMFQRR